MHTENQKKKKEKKTPFRPISEKIQATWIIKKKPGKNSALTKGHSNIIKSW